MIECIFGWGKQHGAMRKAKHRGIARVAAGISAEPHRLQPYTHPEIDRCLGGLRKDIYEVSAMVSQISVHQHKMPHRNGKTGNFRVFQQTARAFFVQVAS